MQTLPINHVLPELKEKLLKHNKLVLQAPPGAGKTTALPLALLDELWLKGKKIIMLEPRRLAVRASASRMAELLGEKVGESVGYQIKMESVQSKKTKILIVTEGILTRKLQSDPSLEDTALIIFDEFHERSLHADLSLALALESQALLREDMKILIMSATLNTIAISKLLDNAPIITSEGRSFPIENIYLDASSPQPSKKELPFYVHKLLIQLLNKEEGNILVFLSGVREIKTVERLLNESKLENVYISTLYGNLNKEAQDRAIKAPPDGFRKVVLSTNIAQTSLTIEGIKIVVDSGLQNISMFNPFSGMNKLESTFISQDSATQRAGRAGRVSAGKAYHLWHKSKILVEHDIPEILLADLSQMALELAVWGVDDINEMQWMDRPPVAALTHAQELLTALEAIDTTNKITPHGIAMSRFPLHPRLAHMMLKAKELNLSYEASLLAVLITEKDIYTNSFATADLKERVLTLHDISNNNSTNAKYVNTKQCHYILKNAKRIEKEQKSTINIELLGVLLAFAYPDRIAKQRQGTKGSFLLTEGKGAKLHKEDDLASARFIVASDLDNRSSFANIYKAIEITQDQIENYLPDLIEKKEEVTWNEEQQRVEVRQVERLGNIVLKATQVAKSNNSEIAQVLIEEIEELGLSILNWSKEASALKDRVDFLNFHAKDFPDFSENYLEEHMHEWLAPYLNGITTLKACQKLDLYNILLGQLSYEQSKELNSLAPKAIEVASGSKININYNNPEEPILAVRLQEMFGTKTTPTLLNGKVKLMLHLLSPASRPMQMTKDIESFWENTYADVKKELRGKYKKHYWPDNPLEAQATSKTKKNM